MHHFIFEFIEATLESPLVFQFFCKPIEGMGWAKKRQPWVNYGLIKYSYTKMFGHINRWTGTPMNGMEWSGPGHGPGTWSVLLCSKPNAIVFYSSMHISPTSCTMANTHPNRQTRTLSPRVLQFRESWSPGALLLLRTHRHTLNPFGTAHEFQLCVWFAVFANICILLFTFGCNFVSFFHWGFRMA